MTTWYQWVVITLMGTATSSWFIKTECELALLLAILHIVQRTQLQYWHLYVQSINTHIYPWYARIKFRSWQNEHNRYFQTTSRLSLISRLICLHEVNNMAMPNSHSKASRRAECTNRKMQTKHDFIWTWSVGHQSRYRNGTITSN